MIIMFSNTEAFDIKTAICEWRNGKKNPGTRISPSTSNASVDTKKPTTMSKKSAEQVSPQADVQEESVSPSTSSVSKEELTIQAHPDSQSFEPTIASEKVPAKSVKVSSQVASARNIFDLCKPMPDASPEKPIFKTPGAANAIKNIDIDGLRKSLVDADLGEFVPVAKADPGKETAPKNKRKLSSEEETPKSSKTEEERKRRRSGESLNIEKKKSLAENIKQELKGKTPDQLKNPPTNSSAPTDSHKRNDSDRRRTYNNVGGVKSTYQSSKPPDKRIKPHGGRFSDNNSSNPNRMTPQRDQHGNSRGSPANQQNQSRPFDKRDTRPQPGSNSKNNQFCQNERDVHSSRNNPAWRNNNTGRNSSEGGTDIGRGSFEGRGPNVERNNFGKDNNGGRNNRAGQSNHPGRNNDFSSGTVFNSGRSNSADGNGFIGRNSVRNNNFNNSFNNNSGRNDLSNQPRPNSEYSNRGNKDSRESFNQPFSQRNQNSPNQRNQGFTNNFDIDVGSIRNTNLSSALARVTDIAPISQACSAKINEAAQNIRSNNQHNDVGRFPNSGPQAQSGAYQQQNFQGGNNQFYGNNSGNNQGNNQRNDLGFNHGNRHSNDLGNRGGYIPNNQGGFRDNNLGGHSKNNNQFGNSYQHRNNNYGGNNQVQSHGQGGMNNFQRNDMMSGSDGRNNYSNNQSSFSGHGKRNPFPAQDSFGYSDRQKRQRNDPYFNR